MAGTTLSERLRRVTYGVLLFCWFGFGCNLKGCSCAAIKDRLSPAEKPAEPVFTDVEMVSDGAEPRITLRVARWPGLRYRFITESSGSMGLEGQPQPPGPTVIVTVDNDVIRGSADPIIEHRNGAVVRLIEERSVVDSFRVKFDPAPPQLIDSWNQSLLPLRGSSFRQRVTESAGIAWMKTELLGGLEPPEAVRVGIDAALEAQRHFPFRLPPDAVGVGARWLFKEQLAINGAQVVQAAEMSLKSVEPDLAVIGLTLRQDAARQEVPNPLVPGAKAVLEQFHGEGDGELTIDRLTAIIVRGRFRNKTRFTLSGDVAGKHGVASVVAMSTTEAGSVVLPEADARAEDVPTDPPEPLPSAAEPPARNP